MIKFRVWPDYTFQEFDEKVYEFMGDDFLVIYADNGFEAVMIYRELEKGKKYGETGYTG